MAIGYESIYLDESKCTGCTTCTQRCPVEAIRVRNGKATILRDRCVDCGECIRVCPRHAMRGRVDTLDEVLGKYKHTVALPASALYGQFPGITDRKPIHSALRKIGFDSIFEVSAASEAASALIRQLLESEDIPLPVITTACPVVLRIVRIRFHSLLPHLLTCRSPMEIAARWSKRLVAKKTGLNPEDIGCIYISPCPAKCTSAKAPLNTPHTATGGVVSISEVVPRITRVLKDPDLEPIKPLAEAGAQGIGWAMSGGQSAAVMEPNYLAASGIENVIRILEALEDGKLSNVKLVELNACYPGCVGGVLTVENPFIAKARIQQIMRVAGPVFPADEFPADDLFWERKPTASTVMQLDEDLEIAMEKIARIRSLTQQFQGIDCGACGSPSCRALAEDIVAGRADAGMCVFKRIPTE